MMREDWIEVELGELSTYEIGGDWGKDIEYQDPSFELAYCIRGSEFRHWKTEKAKTASLRKVKKTSIEKRSLKSGDILVEISGGGPDQPVGRTVLIDKSVFYNFNNVNVIHTNFLRLLRPNILIDSLYLNYYLNCFYQSGEIVKYQAGSNNLRNLKFNDYLTISVPLAPLPEQRAIAAKIEQLFSELDNGIANLKAAKSKLEIYRQAVLKQAFEGGWDKATLEEVSEAVGGYAFKSELFEDYGKYQVIKIGNVKTGNLKLHESPSFINCVEDKILDKYLLKNKDIVITLTGTRRKRDYGFTAIVYKPNLLINQRLAYLRFNKTCLPEFFLYFSWTELFKEQFFSFETGNVGQGNVGMKSIKTAIIPIPSIEEQTQIVQEIETRLSVCDKLNESIDQSLEKAQALRQSILKKAFEGKLLSPDELQNCRQQPDWEPAAKLLERVKKDSKTKR